MQRFQCMYRLLSMFNQIAAVSINICTYAGSSWFCFHVQATSQWILLMSEQTQTLVSFSTGSVVITVKSYKVCLYRT